MADAVRTQVIVDGQKYYKIPDGDNTGPISFEHSDGFINPGASGSTGDIMFTTTGHASGDTYTVLLEGYKTY